MAAVRGSDTRPEIIVRSIVHRLGFRFRKHKSGLPGNPDIVLARYHKIIFVHGCFWHGHRKCKRSSRPSSNRSFWEEKLDKNIRRDKKNMRILKSQGWKIIVVWGCQFKNEHKLYDGIAKFLSA